MCIVAQHLVVYAILRKILIKLKFLQQIVIKNKAKQRKPIKKDHIKPGISFRSFYYPERKAMIA